MKLFCFLLIKFFSSIKIFTLHVLLEAVALQICFAPDEKNLFFFAKKQAAHFKKRFYSWQLLESSIFIQLRLMFYKHLADTNTTDKL